MEHTMAFVSIDTDIDDIVVIDMDETYSNDFVTIEEGTDNDFIMLSDDVEIASDADIIDIFSDMDDADVSFIV